MLFIHIFISNLKLPEISSLFKKGSKIKIKKIDTF